ncbi:MAG: glycerophosphodiester phosphodiesterase family protein [Planctomycetota bacterium]
MSDARPGALARSSALFDELRSRSRPIIVAHRGWSSRHPENTVPAFEAAIACGAEMIEFDVHVTQDGEVVVIHDETLDRTTDVNGRLGRSDVAVAGTDLATLRTLDAGSWFGPGHAGASIPTLREALRSMSGRVVPMIEHKGGDVRIVVEVLREARMLDAVILQSFDWDSVRSARSAAKELALGALGEGPLDASRCAEIDALDVGLVHWNHEHLRWHDVRRLRGGGYLTCVYTANTDVELLGCCAAGLDAVTTNEPDRLLSIRRELAMRGA